MSEKEIDPCKILKAQEIEEANTAKEYFQQSQDPKFNLAERIMFGFDSAQEKEHSAARRLAQILRGCIRSD